jgi:Glycosyl hydrolases family 43
MTTTTSEPPSTTITDRDVVTPPGWYRDPYFKGFVRFWDGQQLVGRPRHSGRLIEIDDVRPGLQGVAHHPSRALEPAPTLLEWDAALLIDAAVGTAAAIQAMPRFRAAGNREERSASRHRHRLVGLVILGLLVAVTFVFVSHSGPNPGAASTSLLDSPAFSHDAPDPDVLLVGSTYYAYTTGTSWGNYIGVLRSSSPTSGWTPPVATSHGSSALPSPPSWQELNTQNAPGVVAADGRFLMYYDAVDRDPPYQGLHCLSVATASDPNGPFIDSSTGPMFCDPDGSIDPAPYTALGGQPWLTWKSNDGSSKQSAVIWSARLDAQRTGLSGSPQALLTQDSAVYPWETTVEAPDLVTVDGVTYLFFSAGIWDSSSYSEHYAVCLGAAGPCAMTNADPILSSGGQILGPGSATAFQGTAGNWWMAYDAWSPGCTSYACGGARKLYVSPLTFAASPGPRPTAAAPDPRVIGA